MRTIEEVWNPILMILQKKFQILVTSDLYRLVDDANENRNYIA